MRGAIGPDDTGAVPGERDVQVLQGDIVNQLIVAALQERRINGQHVLEALARQAGGKRHGMLLGATNIELAFGKAFLELDQATALDPGGRYTDKTAAGQPPTP